MYRIQIKEEHWKRVHWRQHNYIIKARKNNTYGHLLDSIYAAFFTYQQIWSDQSDGNRGSHVRNGISWHELGRFSLTQRPSECIWKSKLSLIFFYSKLLLQLAIWCVLYNWPCRAEFVWCRSDSVRMSSLSALHWHVDIKFSSFYR